MKTKRNNTKGVACVTFLEREQIDFLDKVGKDFMFSYGHKISRARMLSALVTLLMNLKIDVKDIDLHREKLWEGLLKLIKNDEDKNT